MDLFLAAVGTIGVLFVSELFYPHTSPVHCTLLETEASEIAVAMREAGFRASVEGAGGKYFVTVPSRDLEEAQALIPF